MAFSNKRLTYCEGLCDAVSTEILSTAGQLCENCHVKVCSRCMTLKVTLVIGIVYCHFLHSICDCM